VIEAFARGPLADQAELAWMIYEQGVNRCGLTVRAIRAPAIPSESRSSPADRIPIEAHRLTSGAAD